MSEGAHQPSGGIIAAAVVEFVGSGGMLLGAAAVVIALKMGQSPAEAPQHALPFSLRGLFIGELVFLLALGTLGIATGVGLLRLRSWARISTLIFAGILAFFAVAFLLPVFVLLALAPPNVPREVMRGTQIVMASSSLLQIGIGVWWLVLFNRANVKAQFTTAKSPASAEALPAGGASPIFRRPLSITIIGWYLIVSGCLEIFPLVLLRMPAFLLVWIWTGWRETAYYSVVALVGVALGVGLLRLSELARKVAIAYYAFTAIVALATPFLPGYQERLEARARAMPFYEPDMRWPHMVWAIWFAVAFALLVCGPIVFFLFRERKAFEAPVGTA